MDRIKDGPLGAWLASVAPDIAKSVGGLIAEKAVWPLVRDMLQRRRMDAATLEQGRSIAASSLHDITTQRWELDLKSKRRLNQIARPLLAALSIAGALCCTILHAYGHPVGLLWESVWAALCATTVGGYFVVQSFPHASHPKRRRRSKRNRNRRDMDNSRPA